MTFIFRFINVCLIIAIITVVTAGVFLSNDDETPKTQKQIEVEKIFLGWDITCYHNGKPGFKFLTYGEDSGDWIRHLIEKQKRLNKIDKYDDLTCIVSAMEE